MSEVLRILEAAQRGGTSAAKELLLFVSHELRRLAAHKMANEAYGRRYSPAARAHQAGLRLVGFGQEAQFLNWAHFWVQHKA